MQNTIRSKASRSKTSVRAGSTFHAPFAMGLFFLASAGCSHHSNHEFVAPVAATFSEAEPNDDVFNANYFGELYPGDLFYIEGFISDDGFDPFDGFAFTSSGPLHVDFRLFIDDVLADFDVCLYDPQLDTILACYESSNNPESGGVDLFDPDLDFHLVVESFAGSGTYSLEIDVLPLVLNSTQEPSSEGIAATTPLLPILAESTDARAAKEARGNAAFDAYRKGRRTETSIRTVTQRSIDPVNGDVVETTTIE